MAALLSPETLDKFARSIIYNTNAETGEQTPRTSTSVRRKIAVMARMLDNGLSLSPDTRPGLANAFLTIIENSQQMQDQTFAMGALRTVISHEPDGALAQASLERLQSSENKMLLGPAYRQTMHELSLKAADPSHQDPMNGFSSRLRAATPTVVA